LTERYTQAVDDLSAAMDVRNKALMTWAAHKTAESLEKFRSADQRYDDAVFLERDLRVELSNARIAFHRAGNLQMYEKSVHKRTNGNEKSSQTS